MDAKDKNGGNKMDNNLAKAYAEVDKILSYVESEYVEKIPRKMRELFKNEKLKDYEVKIDKNKPLDEQKLQRKTLAILALININYWCKTQKEKQELLKLYAKNDRKIEEELLEKYNPDNIFKKKEINEEMEKITENITSIVEYKKESFIKKILKKIKNLFKK